MYYDKLAVSIYVETNIFYVKDVTWIVNSTKESHSCEREKNSYRPDKLPVPTQAARTDELSDRRHVSVMYNVGRV